MRELLREYALKVAILMWMVVILLTTAGCASAPQRLEEPAVVVTECDPMTTLQKIQALMNPYEENPLADREEFQAAGRSIVVIRTRCEEA